MSQDTDTAVRYLQHAAELRVIAASKQSTVNREALLGIAKDYERMAASLEAIEASNKKLRAVRKKV